jgi:serine protease Do
MVIDEIRQYGHFRNVWTGLRVSELTPEVVEQFEIPFRTGLVVVALEEGGPAERAGMQVGDVIVEMEGTVINNSDQASRVIFGKQVGDDLDMTVWRSGSTISIKLKLVEREEEA